MRPPIACEGAPRDLGLDQGVAERTAIRDWAARHGASSRRSLLTSLRPLASGSVLGRGAGREILRHHPHAGERMDGIARAAGVSLASVVDGMLRGADAGAELAACDLPACAIAAAGGVARALPAHPAPGGRFLLRRSIPEIGFQSVEVTLPWLASAVAGVNEKGLCVAIVPAAATGSDSGWAPPAILLVQDCLQRFADLESALEWCARRPAAGGVDIVIADEGGDSAAVLLDADGCRILRAGSEGEEAIVRGGDGASEAELRKLLQAGEAPASALRKTAGPHAAAVQIDATTRRLTLELGAERVIASALPETP